MILEWGLILSVTFLSSSMLMMISTYFAILPEAQQFYRQSRTMVLLLANSFNISYILITPIMFRAFSKYFYCFVLGSTFVTSVGVLGRYLAEDNYLLALICTILVSIAHIPIITAPYGILKLFPEWQKGYAASIPLFLPVLGINFCILYGIGYISQGQTEIHSLEQQYKGINDLNFIIAVVGVFSSFLTIVLLRLLKQKINQPSSPQKLNQETEGDLQKAIHYLKNHKFTMILLVCWGGIVGVNWTYGSLFAIIFEGQGLSEKEIAVLGLAANLSSALFSNLGTFLHNRFYISPFKLITYLNILGLIAAIFIQYSHFVVVFQQFYVLIAATVILRAGYSSFVSLSFVEMEKSGISSVTLSGIFFWVANVINLLGMELLDLVPAQYSMLALILAVSLFIWIVSESLISQTEKI